MDLRPLARPKHIVLTLLVGLLAGGTIATAAAGVDPDVPAGLASPVSFPARAVGDRGLYEIWDHPVPDGGDESTWGTPDRTLAFEWLPDEQHLDADGRLVWTNVVFLQSARWDDGVQSVTNATALLRAGTNVPLGVLTESEAVFGAAGAGPVPTESTTSEGGSRNLRFGDGAWAGDPCLMLPTAGRRFTLEAPDFPAFDDCWWAAFGYEHTATRLQAVGGTPGQRDVLLRTEIPDLLSSYTVGRAWLREDNPYAIRFDRVSEEAPVAVAVLRAFDAGTIRMRTGGDDPTTEGVPPLRLAPRQAWGPDEAGVPHDFPMSAAFAAARDAPGYADLRQLLADHPDAYVGWAQYAAYADGARSSQRWTFGVTDGRETLGIDLFREVPTATSVNEPLRLLQGQGGPRITITPVDGTRGGQFVPLDPAAAPAQVPSVASLLATWKAYAAVEGRLTGLDANAWDFQVGADPDGPGGHAASWFRAGHVAYAETADLPTEVGMFGPATYGWTTSTAHWQDDGEGLQLASFTESVTTSRRDTVALPVQPPGAQPSGVAPADERPTAVKARHDRFEWTPRERAAIGLGALGAALLWWLSPLAKGGLSGLFSRIRDDELLENPTRRLARDLVEANPGIHHQDLVRRLGKGKGGAEHHLRKLVDGGVLLRRAAHGYTCYFLPAQASRAAIAAAPLLKSEVAQRILELRRAQPFVTNAELARRLDVKPATIHYHVTRLRDAGLLVDLRTTEDTAQAA